MQEVYSRKIFPSNVRGYSQTWFCGPDISDSQAIEVSEEHIEKAYSILKVRGVPLVENSENGLRWQPLMGRYTTTSYLLNATVGFFNELKQIEDSSRFFPKYVLTLVSETEEGIKETAEKLNLESTYLVGR